jgi:hypothetical protein
MFAGDLTNYYVPSEFVNSHRTLRSGNRVTTVAMNSYVMPTFAGIPALPSITPAKDSSELAADPKQAGPFHWSRYGDLTNQN